jgi:hypothetical protein
MALARYQRAIQDGSGSLNLLGIALQCEVRRAGVAGTPKAVLYSDRDGTVTLGNPFAVGGGVVAFHAAGGAYNVRVYGAGYDETFTYEAIGTGAEVDADTLLIPGYLYEFETGTTSPPGDGGIRANNADLSVANRLWIHKDTIAAIDVSPRIEGLETKRILVTSTNAGEQVGWDVDLVTDEGDYYELVLSEHVGATALAAGRCGWIRDPGEGPAGLDGALSGDEVVLTTTSETLIAAYKGKTILLNSPTAMALAAQPAATLGADWMAIVKNIGAGTATLDPDAAETVDGAATLAIPQNMSMVLWSDGAALKTGLVSHAVQPLNKGGSGTALTAPGVASVFAHSGSAALFRPASDFYMPGTLYGLTTSNSAGDATNDITIAAGRCVDSTGVVMMVLPSALTKQLDGGTIAGSWAVGDNQGMRDTGNIGNATWHLFLIMRPDTGVVDVLASVSATAPTLPANYVYFRRIASIVRTGAAIKGYVQVGDFFAWKVPNVDYSTSNPGNSAVALTLTVPTGIRVLAELTMSARDGSAGADSQYLITANDQTDTAASTVSQMSISSNGSATVGNSVGLRVMSDTSAGARFRMNGSNSDINVSVTTHGFADTRGRLAA